MEGLFGWMIIAAVLFLGYIIIVKLTASKTPIPASTADEPIEATIKFTNAGMLGGKPAIDLTVILTPNQKNVIKQAGFGNHYFYEVAYRRDTEHPQRLFPSYFINNTTQRFIYHSESDAREAESEIRSGLVTLKAKIAANVGQPQEKTFKI